MEECLFERMRPFLGDLQKLYQRMAGQMELWEECVRLFPGEEVLEEADRAVRERKYQDLYVTVHRLKGNLANFGFDKAAETAMAVLAAIKAGDDEQADIQYKELKAEYIQIIERIGEVG